MCKQLLVRSLLALSISSVFSYSGVVSAQLMDSDGDGMPDDWESYHGLDFFNPMDAGEDPDLDGLTNLNEYLAKTNPQNADTDFDMFDDGIDIEPTNPLVAEDSDADGLPNGWEIRFNLDPNYPGDAHSDYDIDGLTAFQEYQAETYPNRRDSDGDGVVDGQDVEPSNALYRIDSDGDNLPDGYESSYPFLDPFYPSDANQDFDGDQLSNVEEYLRGTDPGLVDSDGDGDHDFYDQFPTDAKYRLDSDGDGMPDAFEQSIGSDYLAVNWWEDFDGDGLNSLEEFEQGTDVADPNTDDDWLPDGEDYYPLNSLYAIDEDKDGMPSEFEWQFGFSDLMALDGGMDLDGDSLSNSFEFFLGTSPNNPDSDNDGVMDGEDLWPTDRTKALDTDADGLPDSWEVINGFDWMTPFDAVSDDDFDGLAVIDEYRLGTDPRKSDTDGDGAIDSIDLFPLESRYSVDTDNDGMPDAYENEYTFLDAHHPLDASYDDDEDGVSNYREFLQGTRGDQYDTDGDYYHDGYDIAPTDARYAMDYDGDEMPDEWEHEYPDAVSIFEGDGHLDADNDGLSNLEEFQLGTLPNNPDTDGDYFSDGEDHFPLNAKYRFDRDRDGMPEEYEYQNGTSDLNTYDGAEDIDYDQLNNSQEFFAGTDPDHPDTDMDGVDDGEDLWPTDRTKALDDDNDGLPNAWEIINGFNPQYPFDAQEDFDELDGLSDGLTLLEEYQAGTDWKRADTDRDGVFDGEDFDPLNENYTRDDDGDGLPAEYEEQFFFLDDWNLADASDDWDGDQLSNREEFELGTNPDNPDTDSDGYLDGDDYRPLDQLIREEFEYDQDGDGLPNQYERDNGLDDWRDDSWEDLDNDRLTNLEEYLLGTDPQNPDSDDDGMYDGDEHFPLDPRYRLDMDRDGMPHDYEMQHGTGDWNTNDGADDPDYDQLNNSQEFFAGTDPQNPDTDIDGVNDGEDLWPTDRTKALDDDNDGLPNAWEIINGFNPQYPFDAQEDFDELDGLSDGLTLLEEYQAGTDWKRADTDRDGVFDGEDFDPLNENYTRDDDGDGLPTEYEEQFFFLDDWNLADASDDWDGDQLSNREEFELGTNPDNPDTDNDGYFDGDDYRPLDPMVREQYDYDNDRDGLPDEYEWDNGLDAWRDDSWEDLDGDRLTNLDEYLLGTDPNNSDTDNDGAYDGDEHFPLDPRYRWDMDRDGMPEQYEMLHGTSDWNTNDGAEDPDYDQFNNSQEYFAGTNPQIEDTDFDGVFDGEDLWPLDPTKALDSDLDGMADAWEILNELNPNNPIDASDDLDADGLTNREEFVKGTDLNNPDTDQDGANDGADQYPLNSLYTLDSDGDGLADEYENAYPFALYAFNPDDANFDFDFDFLSNAEEFALGTNPEAIDTDGDGIDDKNDFYPLDSDPVTGVEFDFDQDGLPNTWESQNGLSGNNPSDAWEDFDGDFLTNLEEFKLGTDPQNADTDEDGWLDSQDRYPLNSAYQRDWDRDTLPDSWETFYGLNPSDTYDALLDIDNDGLNNIEEFKTGGDPSGPGIADRDGDGISDFDEITHGLNPDDPSDAAADWDGDSLNNRDEIAAGTDIYNWDTDFDGLTDGFEVQYGFNPVVDGGEAYQDSDGDGLTNLQESVVGTDPYNTDSDGDLVADNEDAFPADPSESIDTDGDQVGNNADTDDDNDGLADTAEAQLGSDPLNSDSDGDGIVDGVDTAVLDSSLPRIASLVGANNLSNVGESIVVLGDVNSDGIDDFAVSEAGYIVSGSPNSGAVRIYSGADASVIRLITADETLGARSDGFASQIANAGDMNADGISDLVIAAPSHQIDGSYKGAVHIVSSIDGSLINSFFATGDEYQFGNSLSSVGDINDDNVPDFAVGIRINNTTSFYKPQAVKVISGIDGATLFAYQNLGDSNIVPDVINLGDVNSDGVNDFAYGAGTPSVGYINVQSGLDGSLLYIINHSGVGSSNGGFGRVIASAGDLNDDGINDIVTAAEFDSTQASAAGAVFIHSGVDGSRIGSIYGGVASQRLGNEVSAVGDIDGDGYPDIAASSSGYSALESGDTLIPSIDIYSGKTGRKLASADDNAPNFNRTFFGGIGDINADGVAEVLVSTPYIHAGGFSYGGIVSVLSFTGDNDADGLPHIWETRFGLNPLDASDAALDGDSDGLTNLEEYQAGTNPEVADTDGDGVLDGADPFPADETESADFDGDGIGNNADPDDDNDLVADVEDVFPLDPAESVDTDLDGIGNNADTDDDNDLVADASDAFPLDPNESLDTDLDGIGNNADPDDDNDSVADASDAFPLDPTESVDTDLDGIGNNADPDDDNDTVADIDDAFPLDPAESLDTDLDGIGNNADPDDDNDGVADASDLFPLDGTEWEDFDLDGIGNNADPDDDNDLVADVSDAFPFDANEWADTDGDGVGDNADVFPNDATEVADNDNDGIGDNADTDDDNDQMPDVWELANNFDPLSALDARQDADEDRYTNLREFELSSDPNDVASPGSPFLQTGAVQGVSTSSWTTVSLDHSYASMVVVATPVYDLPQAPLVVRVRNAVGSSFEVTLVRLDGSSVDTNADVNFTVVEEGDYQLATHGITMEAVRYVSGVTDRKGSWSGEASLYINNYVRPVVVGQVMSANDPDFSVFWSRGSRSNRSANASNLYVGKHVAEDPDRTRVDETLGYLVVEQGSGTINGYRYEAALGADVVRGLTNGGYDYALTMTTSITSAIASNSGMDGGDGGWAVLRRQPTSGVIPVSMDEDTLNDNDRNHTTEEVGYIVFSAE